MGVGTRFPRQPHSAFTQQTQHSRTRQDQSLTQPVGHGAARVGSANGKRTKAQGFSNSALSILVAYFTSTSCASMILAPLQRASIRVGRRKPSKSLKSL